MYTDRVIESDKSKATRSVCLFVYHDHRIRDDTILVEVLFELLVCHCSKHDLHVKF